MLVGCFMRWRLVPLAALLLFSATAYADDGAPSPAPHFMSLKTEGANGRRGPSNEQPVLWVYERAGLPLLVTGESGPWRRVRDPDGAETWMNASNLEERRTVLIRGTADVALRSDARENGRPVAFLAPGVVGSLTGCQGEWRRVAVGGRVGWVAENALWGADQNCDATAN